MRRRIRGAAALLAAFCTWGAAAAGADDTEALTLALIRSAAEKGNAAEQYELARRYQLGIGAPKDDVESLKWLRRAAEAGNAGAQYDLGERYARAKGVPESREEADKWYRRAADQGDFRAQREVGAAYFQGRGVTKDCAQAAQWFRRAAAEDDPTAQFHLGVLHATACGVKADDGEAARWYRLAAEGGHAGAQLTLGIMYHAGRGVERSAAEAVKWFRRSQMRRDRAALASNGADTAGGSRRAEGIPQDDALAFFWLSLAVAEGDTTQEAPLDTVQRRLRPGQLEDALGLLKRWQITAEANYEEVVFLLGATSGISRVPPDFAARGGQEALSALTAALQTAHSSRYIAALSGIVRDIGPAARAAGPALAAHLSSSTLVERFRPSVALALAHVDPERGKAAVPVLEKCSLDPMRGSFGRLECLLGLDFVGSVSASTRLALLEDEDVDLRIFAALGLRAAPASAILGPLTARLKDPSMTVRVSAAASLLMAVPDPPAAALPTLLEGVCQGNGFDAKQAVAALEEVPRERALEALAPLEASLRAADARCRTWAAVAISRVDRRRALPFLGLLREALQNEDDLLRSSAAETLALLGEPAGPASP